MQSWQKLVKEYTDPIVVVDKGYNIAYANDAARQFFGDWGSDTRCYSYIYGKQTKCPLCVTKDIERLSKDTNSEDKSVRRCRIVENEKGEHKERYVVVTPCHWLRDDWSHAEIFAPVPKMQKGIRAIMQFGKDLEDVDDFEEVLKSWVDFLSSDDYHLRWRAQIGRAHV
jgi:hypothetical protein